jgi:hypothetical protein
MKFCDLDLKAAADTRQTAAAGNTASRLQVGSAVARGLGRKMNF